MRRALIAVGLVAATLLPLARPAAAAPSAAPPAFLDPTFGTNGVATFGTTPHPTDGFAIARQADGKILVGGSASVDATHSHAVVARFRPDGQVDTTFGTSGLFTLDTANQTIAIAVQPDGKAIVAVRDLVSPNEAARVALLRLDASGHLDTGFGTGGVVPVDATLGLNPNTVRARVVVQPDGGIVVANNTAATASSPSAPIDFLVARFTPDGVLDSGFGTAGLATVDFSTASDTRDDMGTALALLPDGHIVVGGLTFSSTPDAVGFAVARLTAAGTLDTTFGDAGKVLTFFGDDVGSRASLEDVAVQADGEVVAVGRASTAQGTGDTFLVVRYTAAGAVDPGFGTSGRAVLPFGGHGTAVTVDSGGRIVAGGFRNQASGSGPVAVRLLGTGDVDTTFGGGVVALPLQAGDTPIRLAAEPGGKVIAGGGAGLSAARFRSGTGGSSWGWNPVGELGNGTTSDAHVPLPVIGLAGAVSVSSGLLHGVALKGDQTVWAWGWNGVGQLGNGLGGDSAVPAPVALGVLVTAVAAGAHHNLAVAADKTVWTWGWNAVGQLGDGTTSDRHAPVHLGLTDVVAVAGGWYHSLAVKADGTVWAWGWNGVGELGDGTTVDHRTPVQVPGLANVVAVAAGAFHSLALKADGTVWAWGWNGVGQLGDGTTVDRHTPVQVANLAGVATIAAGAHHDLATGTDGSLHAWGWNATGQLGDGTTTDRHTPVTIASMAGTTAVAAGPYHSVAAKTDGTVWAWGYNGGGELGNATTADSFVPVHSIAVITGFGVAAGLAHTYAVASA